MTRAGGAHVDVDDVVLRRWFFIHLFIFEQLQTNLNFDISEFFQIILKNQLVCKTNYNCDSRLNK